MQRRGSVHQEKGAGQLASTVYSYQAPGWLKNANCSLGRTDAQSRD
jgi:hypothetical protein